MQRPSTLAASQLRQGPATPGSLADTALVSVQPQSSVGDSLLQPVQASAAEQLLHASAPEAAVAMEAAALLPGTASLPAASNANSTPPVIAAAAAARTAAAAAKAARKGLKPALPMSPQVAMRQRLQHSRTGIDSSKQQPVQPSELPVTYVTSTLAQPGPLFMKSFPESSLDNSTTLPQANSGHRHGQASAPGECVIRHAAQRTAQRWHSIDADSV